MLLSKYSILDGSAEDLAKLEALKRTPIPPLLKGIVEPKFNINIVTVTHKLKKGKLKTKIRTKKLKPNEYLETNKYNQK